MSPLKKHQKKAGAENPAIISRPQIGDDFSTLIGFQDHHQPLQTPTKRHTPKTAPNPKKPPRFFWEKTLPPWQKFGVFQVTLYSNLCVPHASSPRSSGWGRRHRRVPPIRLARRMDFVPTRWNMGYSVLPSREDLTRRWKNIGN